MGWIWPLAVCLAVVSVAAPGSAQSSAKTLFLISGPEVLHAGTPTPLAVTVLADFSVRVVADVEHGNNTVSRAEHVQGGLTRILTLPPIAASKAQSSLSKLTVRGYRGDQLLFTNATSLHFHASNVSSFLQTDRPRYQPGDTVKVRAVSVRIDNRPYTGRVEISVRDPSGNTAERWESSGNLGIVLRELALPQTSPLGEWVATVTVNVRGVTDEKTFIVEHHEAPPFDVLVKMPSRVLVGSDISGSVRALYANGQPVHGTLSVSLSLKPAMDTSPFAFTLTQTKEIYGSTQFFFSKSQLPTLDASTPDHELLYVAAIVNSTGVNAKTAEVYLMKNMYQLEFYDYPRSLKPTLHFSAKLKVSRYDGKPLSSADLESSAVVEITQRKSMVDPENTTAILTVPEDGNVPLRFQLHAGIAMLFIRARFRSREETLTVYNYSSPNSSYIQISPTPPAQVGTALPIDVESTFQLAELHYVVSSRGQVVAAGTRNSSSFSLTPAVSWSPEVCLTVYCVLSDGEVVSDTAYLPVTQRDYLSLKWGSDKAQPGEQVSLTATVAETESQVAVMVVGTHDEAPRADPDLKVGQKCSIQVLTNARMNTKKQPDGFEDEMGNALMVETYSYRMLDAVESFLWFDVHLSDSSQSWDIKVPDGITSLRAVALGMSEDLGLGFTPVPQKLTVSKDFSLSLDVPSYLIRGEQIVLEVNVINHLERDIEVIVLLAASEAFRFVLADRGDVSVVNAQKLLLGSHVSASAMFPIRPVALGEMEISVDAVSVEASDSLVWRVLVKPEGVEQLFSQTLFLELEPTRDTTSSSASFSFPPHVVPGSQRAQVAVVGDILALSFNSLDSLVQIPVGCGEQNVIHFAPSIYVLHYLKESAMDDQELRSRALDTIKMGYQRQLSYRRDDGSFSAFGGSDGSGSTWLTAFVLRCFLQAQPFMQVDQRVLTGAMTWLLNHQGPHGEFREAGRLIHTEMQGALDNGSVALTAYVLMALLEDDSYVNMFPANVSLAQKYLESQVTGGRVSNYSLCLVAYALALANSPVAGAALEELSRRADRKDGVMMWSSSAGPHPLGWQPRSAQIEMTSYVLLALFRRGNFLEGITLMKWLCKQRNHLGGYGSTQDTVIALQALASYAAFSGSNAIMLRLNISTPTSQLTYPIDSTNFRKYHSQEINAEHDLHINISLEGRGFAVFQMNIFYNLESAELSQDLQHSREQEAFLLGVDITYEDHNHMWLSICTRLKDNQVISQTGMAIIDVGMLSGFSLSPKAAAPSDLIRKVEILPEKVCLYLQSLNKSEVCIRLPVIREYKVARVQDAMVQVYDYYEPMRRARTTYNSQSLRDLHPCSFCGKDCDRCRPGITVTVPHSYTSHATGSRAFSSVSCFLVGVAAYFHCSLIS